MSCASRAQTGLGLMDMDVRGGSERERVSQQSYAAAYDRKGTPVFHTATDADVKHQQREDQRDGVSAGAHSVR